MILLVESKVLFDKFQTEYWPNYETEGGKKEFRTYLRLVLMTSVLEPKHYYHRVAYNRILMVSRYFSSTVEAELVDGLERRAAIIAFHL